MVDDRLHDDALNRFWNDLVEPDGDPMASDLDPDQVETLQRLHAMTRTPPPAMARTRVDRAMHERLTVPHNGMGATTMSQATIFARSSGASDPTGWSPRQSAGRLTLRTSWRGFRWAGTFATALLLLVILGVGYLVVRSGTPNNQRLSSLPVLEAPASPIIDESGARTLAAITLPAGTVPSPIVGGLNHYTIPAGTSSSTASTWVSTCCTGPRLDYVLTGSFTMRNEGPVQLLPAGTSTWETITAKSEITLNPGDAILLRMQDAFAAENANVTPVELVEGVLFEGTVNDDPIPQGWVYHDKDIVHRLIPVPSSPVTLRLLEATLDPDATLPLPSGAVLQLAVTLDEQATVGTRGDFDKRNLGKAPVALYVLTLEPAEVGPPSTGTPSP